MLVHYQFNNRQAFGLPTAASRGYQFTFGVWIYIFQSLSKLVIERRRIYRNKIAHREGSNYEFLRF